MKLESVMDKVVKDSQLIGNAHKDKLNEFVRAIRYLAGEKDRMHREMKKVQKTLGHVEKDYKETVDGVIR
jgi:hypothetical protein